MAEEYISVDIDVVKDELTKADRNFELLIINSVFKKNGRTGEYQIWKPVGILKDYDFSVLFNRAYQIAIETYLATKENK